MSNISTYRQNSRLFHEKLKTISNYPDIDNTHARDLSLEIHKKLVSLQ